MNPKQAKMPANTVSKLIGVLDQSAAERMASLQHATKLLYRLGVRCDILNNKHAPKRRGQGVERHPIEKGFDAFQLAEFPVYVPSVPKLESPNLHLQLSQQLQKSVF